jgi:acrylyl-CoA reductase (NADPH)
MGFNALVVEKAEDGVISQSVQSIEVDQLPEGEVLVDVEYSTLNYKDGLCLTGNGGLVRNYPHVPGIDYAGTVSGSSDSRYKAGDKVVLTGWRVGEVSWGGYAQKARAKADTLVPLPNGLTTKQAMAVGTAGFTSMLSVMALENHGLKAGDGTVLVTGAAGGVGSVAVAILAALGHDVAGVTGRPEQADYLTSLGASQIIAREELAEPSGKPLEKEMWAGCVDAVGGPMLAKVLTQMAYGGSVAAVGLAGGAKLLTTVIPFLLRGVNLLGIDSVMQPYAPRVEAWNRIASDLPMDKLEAMVEMANLSDLPALGASILKGGVKGRVVVDVNA